MPTPTYDLIASQVLSTSASSVTFSSIPATYRDLVLVVECTTGSNTYAKLVINSDTGANYNRVLMSGDGSTATSGTSVSSTELSIFGTTGPSDRTLTIAQLLDYSATDKHKSILMRQKNRTDIRATADRWASTSAITSLEVVTAASSFNAGSTFYLYGIAS